MEPKNRRVFSLINDSISCITCVIVYSPVHTLISILLIYSVTDALNVYMYVMYLVFETFHMQELYPTTLYRLHSSELSRGARLCQRGTNVPPPHPPLNEALLIRRFALPNLCDLNPTSSAASVAQLVERLP